jgi:hypothetical protein
MAALVTLEPIWRRVVPWPRLRRLLQVSTLLAWIALGLMATPYAVRWSSSADLTTRARTFLRPDGTPTFTPQQLEYVAAVEAQQRRERAMAVTPTPVIRTTAADLALVSSTCNSAGLPPITTCRGSLRNVSGRSLSGLQVTLSWSATQGGAPQLSASASIDLDPLLPDQTSSWTVVNRYNDALRWYGTKVTDISGTQLRVRDERALAP